MSRQLSTTFLIAGMTHSIFAYILQNSYRNEDGVLTSNLVFSIDASQLSTGCAAYTYLLAGSQPYAPMPFYQ